MTIQDLIMFDGNNGKWWLLLVPWGLITRRQSWGADVCVNVQDKIPILTLKTFMLHWTRLFGVDHQKFIP